MSEEKSIPGPSEAQEAGPRQPIKRPPKVAPVVPLSGKSWDEFSQPFPAELGEEVERRDAAGAQDTDSQEPPSKLFPCPDCGASVSRRAVACPYCGCPILIRPPIPPTIARDQQRRAAASPLSLLANLTTTQQRWAAGGMTALLGLLLLASARALGVIAIIVGISICAYAQISGGVDDNAPRDPQG